MECAEPSRDCPICPRLAAFREQNRAAFPDFFNAPVPSFGEADARLLIVGLAPGLRGANRTGRPFTGDWAGDLLYPTLLKAGLARGRHHQGTPEALQLVDCMITNAVRCVPPQNKPTPEEIRTCRRFLTPVFSEMPHLKAVVTLGKIAHDSTLAALGAKASHLKFGHGASGDIGGLKVFASYHCSRYNTNTGVLTPAMFHAVFQAARAFLAT
jgi:uracil-DNA glycosylase family 4